jgi:hypothetical protein
VEQMTRGVARVAPGRGRRLWVLGDLYEFKAVSEDTGGAYAAVEVRATPGLPGPPPHIHHREDEAFYVLEGEPEPSARPRHAHLAGTDQVHKQRFERLPLGGTSPSAAKTSFGTRNSDRPKKTFSRFGASFGFGPARPSILPCRPKAADVPAGIGSRRSRQPLRTVSPIRLIRERLEQDPHPTDDDAEVFVADAPGDQDEPG